MRTFSLCLIALSFGAGTAFAGGDSRHEASRVRDMHDRVKAAAAASAKGGPSVLGARNNWTGTEAEGLTEGGPETGDLHQFNEERDGKEVHYKKLIVKDNGASSIRVRAVRAPGEKEDSLLSTTGYRGSHFTVSRVKGPQGEKITSSQTRRTDYEYEEPQFDSARNVRRFYKFSPEQLARLEKSDAALMEQLGDRPRILREMKTGAAVLELAQKRESERGKPHPSSKTEATYTIRSSDGKDEIELSAEQYATLVAVFDESAPRAKRAPAAEPARAAKAPRPAETKPTTKPVSTGSEELVETL